MPVLDDMDEINKFGKIVQYVPEGNGIILVMPENREKLFDLDNIVTLSDKKVIGFVADVVGPVSMPLYSVALYKNFVESMDGELETSLRDYLMEEV